ncbi:hypothetical protein [Salipaludibacillus neizhouensis]|nr:hypothetical protein [Salipaludibacillus neizhouensis]
MKELNFKKLLQEFKGKGTENPNIEVKEMMELIQSGLQEVIYPIKW